MKKQILWKVLIADDEPNWIERYESWVRQQTAALRFSEYLDPEIKTAQDGESALRLLEEDEKINIVFADIFMPPYCNADNVPEDRDNKAFGGIWLTLEIYNKFRERGIQVLLISGKTEAKRYEKKWLGTVPHLLVDKFSGQGIEKLRNDLWGKTYIAFVKMAKIHKHVSSDSPILHVSAAMREVIGLAGAVKNIDTPVLITGPSGVGKELIARHIHDSGKRCKEPLVAVNCAGIPDTLLEAELFGHEKGAFTGAIAKTAGFFREAEKGSLFLDEIGDMSINMQAKLLRAIQQKEIQVVGGSIVKVDTRIIAITNKNLQEELRKGRFREDLFYRLNVFPIFIPSLAERKEDIPVLIDHFLEKFNNEMGKTLEIDLGIRVEMLSYPWPGNVRELQHVIERAVIIGDEKVILKAIRQNSQRNEKVYELIPAAGIDVDKVLGESEKGYYKEAFERTNGNITEAAKLLNLAPKTLHNRLRKYGLIPDRNGSG